MIKAQNLVKWFGPKLAVDDVSLTVERGEVLGFLGPNGAGKSTTMRIITGFLPPSNGKVEIGGHDMAEDGIAARALLGYLPENAPGYPEMTVAGFLSFVAEVRGLRGTAAREAMDRVVEVCHLNPVFYQTIETLSKGFKHRVCFAQSIIHDPPALVMDEPTDGLDPNQKHELRNLIRRMGEEKAIIVSTHILEEVDAICKRVIIIDHGKLVFNGTPGELRAKSDDAGAVSVRVAGRPSAEAAEALKSLPEVRRVVVLQESPESTSLLAYPKRSDGQTTRLAAAVSASLRQRGWSVDELHTESGRLDDVFRAITIGDAQQEGKP
jgi:ABC-2 type transport system ATP-binding protein